jgi:hypothetical protein
MQLMLLQNPMFGAFPGMGLVGMPPLLGMSAQAQFHQPAATNQIKLFVGGLAFQTNE